MDALTIVVAIISLIVTVSIPIGGYTLRTVNKRIDDVKADTTKMIETAKAEAEVRRLETRDHILELVESKFDAIKDTLKDIKDELKDHFREG